MVAPDIQRVWQVLEQAFSVVGYGGGFSVHGRFGAQGACAVGFSNSLMPQAYAKYGGVWAKAFNDVDANSCFFRGAGAGGEHDRIGLYVADILDFQGIVTLYACFHAGQFEIAGEIVNKAVIVVDDQKHSAFKARKRAEKQSL